MRAEKIDGAIGFGVSVEGSSRKERDDEKSKQVKNGVIFAGNINSMMTDRTESKMIQARKQATKIVMDQFSDDNKMADSIKELRGKIAELQEERAALNDYRSEAVRKQDGLKEIFGIEKGGQEQQDLELIRKAKKAEAFGRLNDLSTEELERLANMGELTEYQKESLALDKVISGFDEMIEGKDGIIRAYAGALSSAKTDMLKLHGMVDAGNAADNILSAASGTVMAMLLEEAKEYIDEEMKELVEAAKKAEEKEEQLEKIKEEKKEQEKLVEKISDSASNQEELQQKIDKILKDAELLQEDLKGLVVDGQL